MELKDINFKCTVTGQCDWSTDGKKVTDQDFESVIEQLFDSGNSIVLEHRYFYGSSAPDWTILHDYEDTVEYLNSSAKAGDHILIYSFDEMLNSVKCLTSGKCPNELGEVPNGGAY